MFKSRIFKPHIPVALLVAVLTSGCAIEPGLFTLNPLSSSRHWVGDRVGDAPEGAIVSITPQLIAAQREQANVGVPAEVQALFAEPTPYRIGPGDIVAVAVLDQPELTGGQSNNNAASQGFLVDAAGRIQFPLVGQVTLAGLTEFEAREHLAKALSGYLRDPLVTLRIQDYRSARVFMEGSVDAPGVIKIDDVPMTLPEALSRAGGVAGDGDRSAIAITRGGKTTLVNPVLLAEQGISPASVMLRAGDLVRVLPREETQVYLLGEVTRVAPQPLRNGRLSLYEALASAGGVNPSSGNPRQVFVIRAGNAPKPQIFHVDASTPLAFAMTQGFELKPKDVVFVDPVPLVRWNRVISLVLPSANAVLVSRAASN